MSDSTQHVLILAIGFGLVSTSILAIAAVGFTLQFGVTNILNLAYGDLMTLFAFSAYIANRAGLNIWICLVLAGLLGALASLVLNRFLFTPFIRHGTRLGGMIIVAIAAGVIIQNLILAIGGANFFSYQIADESSFQTAGMVFSSSQVVIICVAVAAMAAIHFLLTGTKMGKAMRATANNPMLARTCGINTYRTVDVAWLLSGALCGIAGVVLVMNVGSFTAGTGNAYLVMVIAAAILGGVGQPYGAMLGALTIGMVSEIATVFINPGYKDLIAFLILVIVLLARPQGILAQLSVQKELVS
jgi:branched-chain amino acid transport system permease protein/neutral amino acid transport system permease protein